MCCENSPTAGVWVGSEALPHCFLLQPPPPAQVTEALRVPSPPQPGSLTATFSLMFLFLVKSPADS